MLCDSGGPQVLGMVQSSLSRAGQGEEAFAAANPISSNAVLHEIMALSPAYFPQLIR